MQPVLPPLHSATEIGKGEKTALVIPVGSGDDLSISTKGYLAFLNFWRTWQGPGSPWSLIWLLAAQSLAGRQGLGKAENTEPGFLCLTKK